MSSLFLMEQAAVTRLLQNAHRDGFSATLTQNNDSLPQSKLADSRKRLRVCT
jgi:hypothetical protein